MSIRFLCPLGHRLKVPDYRVGKKGRCPVCREKVVVPTVGLKRERRHPSTKGEAPAAAESADDRPLRTFDQLASEFLTRETEANIAARMASIINASAKKQEPATPLEAPVETPLDAPSISEPAAVEPAETITPAIGSPSEAADAAFLSFLALSPAVDSPAPSIASSPIVPPPLSSPPASSVPSSPVVPPPPSLPPTLVPPITVPSPPAPPPISVAVAPPVTIAAPPPFAFTAPAHAAAVRAAHKTTWWAWATRETIGRFPVHRPTAPQLEATYWLASLLPFAIVLCAAPAVGHLRLNAAPSWAQIMLLMAGTQLAYAVWLALLPDYSTLQVGACLFAASAALAALGLIAVLSGAAWLELGAAGAGAAVWCVGCLLIMAGLSYACTRVSHRWLHKPAK